MKLKNILLGGIASLMLLALSTPVFASSLIITDVETGNGNLGNVSVGGYGNPWTTPILMTDAHGQHFVVFCDDLNHDVNVGGGQHLPYKLGLVTVAGNGAPLSKAISNEMGQLADLGRYDYLKGNEDGAIAAQAAIWGIEYDTPVSSSDGTIEHFITQDLKVKYDGGGYATGLIAIGGTQSQILGGVPEPATWAMMLMGVFGLGAVLRSSRRTSFGAVNAV